MSESLSCEVVSLSEPGPKPEREKQQSRIKITIDNTWLTMLLLLRTTHDESGDRQRSEILLSTNNGNFH